MKIETIVIFTIIFVALLMAITSDYFLGTNNPIEEIAEDIIEEELHLAPGAVEMPELHYISSPNSSSNK